MNRRLRVFALLAAVGLLGIAFGPVAVRLLAELPARHRATIELARRERDREEHPPPQPFIREAAEPILHAAAARSVRVYRLEPASAGAGRPGPTAFDENASIRRVPVQGMDWGRRFLAEVMRLATMPNEASSREGAGLKPRFGIRFLGADTMDVLLDPHAGPGRAGLLVSWRDSSGRPRRAAALMPFLYQGDPDSDATLQSLKRAPMRN